MATQNTVTIQRQWSKTLGALGLGSIGSLDALYQIFTQLNAVINDNQNYSYVSAALSTGATTTPATGANWWGRANGIYVRVASGSAFAALTGPTIADGSFGLFYFTIDNAGVQRSYPSAGNSALTRAALTLPNPLPGQTEVIVGAIEVAPSGTTFIPGTTNLNAANVNATAFNFTGDTGISAFSMVEQDTA